MPNREISKRIFIKFISDNGWMEIFYEPYYDLIRYITPMGIQIDTIQRSGKVEVMTKLNWSNFSDLP